MKWCDEYLPHCKACQELFGKEPTPCDGCQVELMPGNEDAGAVYMTSRYQVVSDGERVIDISIPAVKIVMDLYRVKDQLECLRKVQWLFHHNLSEARSSTDESL